jgi:SAM-dependent methyltransferase
VKNIDEDFYKFQTRIRNVMEPDELRALCETESNRLGIALKDIIEGLKFKTNATVLDAPCGYGNLLYLYKKHAIDASGLDLDPDQVALARKLNLRAAVGDIAKLQQAEQYDLISSFDFVEHLAKGEALAMLDIFYSALKKGGTLVLRTPCGDTPYGLRDFAEDPTHKWIGTSSCLASMLSICGFQNVMFRDDWPLPRSYRFLRGLIAQPLRGLRRWSMVLTGYGYPVCMSSSMIVIARK